MEKKRKEKKKKEKKRKTIDDYNILDKNSFFDDTSKYSNNNSKLMHAGLDIGYIRVVSDSDNMIKISLVQCTYTVQ